MRRYLLNVVGCVCRRIEMRSAPSSTESAIVRVLIAVALTAGFLASGAAEVPREFQTGMTWGFAAQPGFFASEEARKDVDDMCALGIRWIVLTPNVWQEQYCSTRQFADFERSIPDFELMDIIDYIHRKGMRVQLRPMLECHDGTGRHGVIVGDDWMRVAGKPRNYCRRWFASMRARSVWYARLAERTKCEMYCLDSEFDRFIWKSAEWKDVIAAVRTVYSGPVTSSHTIHCNDFDWEKVISDRTHWFYDLDILSVSDYTGARPQDCREELSVPEMMRNLEVHRDLLRRIAKAYGKPMMFGECGCGPRRFQASSPSGCDLRQPIDSQEQATYYEAFVRTFKDEPWCHGFYWWCWNDHSLSDSSVEDPEVLSASGVSFRPLGAAQEVLRRHYAELNARSFQQPKKGECQ